MAYGKRGLAKSSHIRRPSCYACSAYVMISRSFARDLAVTYGDSLEDLEHNEAFSKQPVPDLARSQLP